MAGGDVLLLMNGWLSQTELECFRISEFVSVGGKCTVESKATASTTASPTSEGLSAKQLVNMREEVKAVSSRTEQVSHIRRRVYLRFPKYIIPTSWILYQPMMALIMISYPIL